jgi:hypothetical protein
LDVNFLSKIIGLKPGPNVHKILANVIIGHDEGIDIIVSGELGHLHNSRVQVLWGGCKVGWLIFCSQSSLLQNGMHLHAINMA